MGLRKKLNRALWGSALFLGCFLLGGCGFVGEQVAEVPPVVAPGYQSPCKLPDLESLKQEQDLLGKADEWIDCGLRQIESLRIQVRGQIEGEISIGEIRYLNHQGLLRFESLEDPIWNTLKFSIGILHPDARPAIRWDSTGDLLRFLKQELPTIREINKANKISPSQFLKIVAVIERFLPLLSEKWELNLAETKKLIDQFYSSSFSSRIPISRASVDEKLDPLWILKLSVIPDSGEQGIWSNLRSATIKQMLREFTKILRNSPNVLTWFWKNMPPKELSSEATDEALHATDEFIRYISKNRFASIDTQLAQWAVRRLTKSNQHNIIPDLARILQRIDPSDKSGGLKTSQLLPVLKRLKSVPPILLELSRSPWERRNWSDSLKRGDAQKLPLLSDFAYLLDRAYEGEYVNGTFVPSIELPQNDYITWEGVMSVTLIRESMREVFRTFDRDEDGTISYTGGNADETKEALDLAYTVLRLFSIQSGPPSTESTEEVLPEWLPVKPSTLYRLLGLVGDRWFPMGNQNGLLDSDEFTMGLLTYQAVQRAGGRVNAPGFVDAADILSAQSGSWYYSGKVLHRRPEMIRGGQQFMLYSSPYLNQELNGLGANIVVKFLDGLIAKAPVPQKILYETNNLTVPVKVTEPVSASEFAPASTIIIALEKLLLACDSHHGDIEMRAPGPDGRWDWKEMDCALPLAVDAGLEAVTSSLLELDPGIHDGARLILSIIGKPGPGLTILKLIASQGGYKKLNPNALVLQTKKWIDDALFLDTKALATFLEKTEGQVEKQSDWIPLISHRYASCDKNGDGKWAGPELSCVMEETITLWLRKFLPPLFAKFAVIRLSDTEEGKIVNHVLKLTAAVMGGAISSDLPEFGVTTSPAKIISLLSEILERREPLTP